MPYKNKLREHIIGDEQINEFGLMNHLKLV
jgi:hypothetical protein